MKLFLILTVAGQISGVWGPLPYGMSECRTRAIEAMTEIREKAKAHGHDVSQWSMHCERRFNRPELGEGK